MKKIAVILLILLYAVSTSGVTGSNFYCCGKLKATHLFSHVDTNDKCRGNNKGHGCCDTRIIFIKNTTSHSLPTQVKGSGDDLYKLLRPLFFAFADLENLNVARGSFALINAPPLIYTPPIYLSHRVFRV